MNIENNYNFWLSAVGDICDESIFPDNERPEPIQDILLKEPNVYLLTVEYKSDYYTISYKDLGNSIEFLREFE